MTDSQLISPEDVIHYAEIDTSGEPGDCIDDCFGCVLDRVVGYLEARADVTALDDEIQSLDGHTLFVDDVAALVRAATEHDPTSDAAQQREERAVAEARPHDDEPGVGTARLAALIGEGLVACEPHPLLHSYTQRYIASVLRGEPRRELTGLEADLNG